MVDYIKNEKVNFNIFLGSKKDFVKEKLLVGEIEGITTDFITIQQGRQHKINPHDNRISIMLFLDGQGRVINAGHNFNFDKITIFVPKAASSCNIKAGEFNVVLLHITMLLNESDQEILKANANNFPYFKTYAECVPYKEEIKSEKTISRTIIPENIIPRLCVGSVQTTGPDVVGAHKHPMLEQLFYGLENNNCVVFANEHTTSFGEHTLLHIPLGSNHGATVAKGQTMFYIWMDFFKNQDDMIYILNSHTTLEE